MERQGSGHIVNVTTTAAEQPIGGSPALLASSDERRPQRRDKGARDRVRASWHPVNAVSLGIIRTQESSYAGLESMDPLRRVGEIDDVVSAVMYLERAGL
jgi:NAD(P)-dependent dehydrogenase (short-subunit alcohol dehydrogenase family)